MSLIVTLLAALLTLPAYYADHETPEARRARMTVIALSIYDATSQLTCRDNYASPECTPKTDLSRRELAFALVVLGYNESRFSLHVHEGKCLPGECDEVVIRSARTGHVLRRYFAARTSWQVHRTAWSLDVWDHLQGTGFVETRNAALAAARSYAAASHRCRSRVGAFSAYAGTKSCRWSGAPARARMLETLLRKYPEATASPSTESALASR